MRSEPCGLWLRRRRSRIACSSGTPPGDGEQTVPSCDLDMEATPLDSDDDDMEEREAGPWRTVALQSSGCHEAARNACFFTKRSIWHSFVDKTCINESDMSGREVGKALLKLSRDGINEMVSTLPPGVIARFMNLQPKIKTIQEIQTSSSSSSSNGPVEFCG